MPRYRLTIAYDGTDFCGWQKQEPLVADAPREAKEAIKTGQQPYSSRTPLIESNREGRVALRTVQGVVEAALRHVVREPIELIGASRTDSGVHARGQVAAFTCEPRDGEALEPTPQPPPSGRGLEDSPSPNPLPQGGGVGWPFSRGADRLMAAINSRLPGDVVVVDAGVADNDFNPVGEATSKCYTYSFHVSAQRPLWDRQFVHHIWHPGGLNVEAMNEAARALVGEHDFAAFAAAGHGRLSTVRRVMSLGVRRDPAAADRVVMEVVGNGFLWNMVRIIAGTLMQVGIGQRTPADVAAGLASRDRAKAGPTLPGTGLCLEWIKYENSKAAQQQSGT